MQTIEFETTAFQHTVRIPDDVPDGVLVRIVLSFDDTKIQNDSNNKHWENLPGTMPNVVAMKLLCVQAKPNAKPH